ncbi:MAG: HD domain-containing protein [Candidatus Paceibacterota bacterium]|jgi:predicted hydrolase (HD superfamily)
MTPQEARDILDQWVVNPNLKKHMWGVGAAMRWYAKKFNADQDRWETVGILHDLDWEKYPHGSTQGHPYVAVAFLKERGLDAESCQAILAHASYTHEPRETLMAKTLFAVDECAGFIVAVALIKPEKKLSAVDVASVMKRLKEKRFAANVNRDEIAEGAQLLGFSLEDHIANVLAGMRVCAADCGL